MWHRHTQERSSEQMGPVAVQASYNFDRDHDQLCEMLRAEETSRGLAGLESINDEYATANEHRSYSRSYS